MGNFDNGSPRSHSLSAFPPSLPVMLTFWHPLTMAPLSNSGTPLKLGTVHRDCACDWGSEVGAYSASPPVIRALIGNVSQENCSWGV